METTCPSMQCSGQPAQCNPSCPIQSKKKAGVHAGICSLLWPKPLAAQKGSPGAILWAAPRGMREQNPDTTNVRMSEGRALALPVTFWAVVSFQRPLPHDGLQVCQQVPLPLSLWELQVRV